MTSLKTVESRIWEDTAAAAFGTQWSKSDDRWIRVGSMPSYKRIPYRNNASKIKRILQMVQLSATRCSFIAILWASLVNFAAITLCVASQRAIPKVSIYFVIDSVRIRLETPSYFFFFTWESQILFFFLFRLITLIKYLNLKYRNSFTETLNVSPYINSVKLWIIRFNIRRVPF
jgi:hypothetical protein